MGQIIKTIRNPNKAAVIQKSVVIIYEDQKEAIVDVKNVKKWKIISTFWWILCLLLGILLFVKSEEKLWRSVTLLLVFYIICLIMIFLYAIGWYVFEWDRGLNGAVLGARIFGLGLSIIHTLNRKKFNKSKHKLELVPTNDDAESEETEIVLVVKHNENIKCTH